MSLNIKKEIISLLIDRVIHGIILILCLNISSWKYSKSRRVVVSQDVGKALLID